MNLKIKKMKIKKLQYINFLDKSVAGIETSSFKTIAEIHLSARFKDYYITTTFPLEISKRFETMDKAKEYLQNAFESFILNCTELY